MMGRSCVIAGVELAPQLNPDGPAVSFVAADQGPVVALVDGRQKHPSRIAIVRLDVRLRALFANNEY